MDAKQILICEMASRIMVKLMSNSPEQNKPYASQAVKAAVEIYEAVLKEVKPEPAPAEPAEPND